MHCWQGDDVIGFDGSDSLSGGIQTTGNYPGRARTADELRADIAFVRTMIPGATKLNLHASYAEKNGKQVDRDAYTIDLFQNWVDFAKEQKIGLDFNPTYFAHPKMDGDFSLSSTNPAIRKFWIEHGKRCREIGLEFAKQLNQPCAINFWMPDGYKDVCADTKLHRDLMIDSLDQIFAEDIDRKLVPCGLESKLFGVGVESYTVASHEFSYGYAIKNGLLYTLDAGHFHPTEVISAKLTACLPFLEGIILTSPALSAGTPTMSSFLTTRFSASWTRSSSTTIRTAPSSRWTTSTPLSTVSRHGPSVCATPERPFSPPASLRLPSATPSTRATSPAVWL